MPCATSHRMVRTASGSPSTGAAAFARASVRGCRRVPSPAVSTSARMLLGEEHVAATEPARVAILQEQAAIRVEHVVVGTAAEALRHRGDPVLASLDLD